MAEPIHLCCTDLSNDPFEINEKIFHRAPDIPPKEFFSTIRTRDFVNGISVNRNKWATPEDTQYGIIQDPDTNQCSYVIRNGKILVCAIDDLKHPNNVTEIEVYCNFTPKYCNKSHCDLLFDPIVLESEKEKIIQLKLFLRTIFDETGIFYFPH